MKSSFYKIFLIILLGALIILLSLQFLSRTPALDKEEIDAKNTSLLIQEEVNKASLLIKEGESSEEVMEGVQILRGILKKDSNQLDAIWELGKLSMQSGQYPKAINRFKKFVSLTEEGAKVSGYIYLSDAYSFNNNRQEALECLDKALQLNKDSKMEIEIQERINIINQN